MISRRQFHLGIGATLAATHLGGLPNAAHAATTDRRLIDEITRLEIESGGRLGVCVLETATGARHAHRGDERFPLCSTFKALATAAVLARVDSGKEQVTRRMTFDASSIVVNSPVTERRTGGDGMTLAEICDAAMTRSDNTAGNLLLAAIGGPAGLTAFARGLGDQVTRLDRDEPSLNQALPDDPRDTTTPNAMASNLQTLILGTTALSAASREQLTAWLIATKPATRDCAQVLPKTGVSVTRPASVTEARTTTLPWSGPRRSPDRDCGLFDRRQRPRRATERHHCLGRACHRGEDIGLGAACRQVYQRQRRADFRWQRLSCALQCRVRLRRLRRIKYWPTGPHFPKRNNLCADQPNARR
jgi:beta-lactamase class A